MRPAEFHSYLQRDQRCYHCGATEGLVPHHRANRGMGGSKSANEPSNIIVVCSVLNNLMESSAQMAEVAREFGWKLSKYENPLVRPVYDANEDKWWRLDNNYKRY